jgi:hypothetical protein
MILVEKEGKLLAEVLPQAGQGNIVQAVQAYRGWLSAGLARRALGTAEVEVTAGATAGATITLPAKSAFIPGDWFGLNHSVNGNLAFWFKGVALTASGAASVPAVADLESAGDALLFTAPDGTSHAFIFVAGSAELGLTTRINNIGGYDDIATSIVVDDASGLSINDIIQVAGTPEFIKITNIVGNTLTVTRGEYGTTPASMSDNAGVYIIPAAVYGADTLTFVTMTVEVTAADVMATFELAFNAAAIGVTSDDSAADGTTILTVDTAGADGNDWVFAEYGVNAGFTVTSPTGGVDDLTAAPQAAIEASDYQIAVDLTGDSTAEDVEATIIAAINTAENSLIASEQDTSIDLNLPTAESGGTGVVKMLTGIIDQEAVWTLTESVTSGTFAIVQASTLDVKVNDVSISGGPQLYTTDDPGTVVVLIAAINAEKANHNYHAYEGTNSSHLALRQRRGGAITGVLSVTVTGSAQVEGGGAVTDFSGDTDTLTEIVSGAAANLPTGTWEILADYSLLDDNPDAVIMHGVFDCDVDIEAFRGRRVAATGRTFATADGEFDLPCAGLGKTGPDGYLISLGVWTVAGNGVLEYTLFYN